MISITEKHLIEMQDQLLQMAKMQNKLMDGLSRLTKVVRELDSRYAQIEMDMTTVMHKYNGFADRSTDERFQ